MKAGMNIQQVDHQLEKIISEKHFQQLIKDAETLVHQQGLYRLLN